MCLCASKQKYELSHWGDEDIKEEDREIALTPICMPLFLSLPLLQHCCQLALSGSFPGTTGQLRACSGHFSHRGRTNFLGLLFFEMFIPSYDLRLLPQALCMGQQVCAQGMGRKETPLHLRPCCPFPLGAVGVSQSHCSQTGQNTPGTTHRPWKDACWHKELKHKQQKCWFIWLFKSLVPSLGQHNEPGPLAACLCTCVST